MNTPSLFEQGEPIIARKGEPGPGVLSVGVMTNPAPAAADPSEGLLGKLKRIFSRKKTVAPARPVQTEWSLDKVTVVRNDLFDDDLEVVLAEVKGGAPAARPAAKRKASATKVAAEQTAALELK